VLWSCVLLQVLLLAPNLLLLVEPVGVRRSERAAISKCGWNRRRSVFLRFSMRESHYGSTERERERECECERARERQRHTHTCRQTDRQTETETYPIPLERANAQTMRNQHRKKETYGFPPEGSNTCATPPSRRPAAAAGVRSVSPSIWICPFC
jgi:hypothetical protein